MREFFIHYFNGTSNAHLSSSAYLRYILSYQPNNLASST